MIALVRTQSVISALATRCSPSEMAARWPRDQALLWLHSGRIHPRWARWSILASPRATFRFDGRSHLSGDLDDALARVTLTHDPLRDLDAVLRATALDATSLAPLNSPLPFRGGWIGSFSYDLGRILEPTAQHRSAVEPERKDHWPPIELAWCPDALVFDHVKTRWSAISDGSRFLTKQNPFAIDDGYQVGAIESDLEPAEYERMVARAIEYIAAGDIFQANVAQRFRAAFEGSSRALAIEAFAQAKPWFGAYLELAGPVSLKRPGRELARMLLSLSPELFLQANPFTRRIITRPIKGTRPASCDARELRDSIKDEAELNMIVDLMRNDLGRVCEFGSVRVSQPRVIESHPTVHHGVAEITGRMRPTTSFGDVLRATFPPGSVTGAPKIRAMQVIDELERGVHRGPYCGAIGFVSDCGAVTLNVAIRTLLVEGCCDEDRCDALRDGEITYSAGAGIVADSIPSREQQEALDKTAVLGALAAGAGKRPRSCQSLTRTGV